MESKLLRSIIGIFEINIRILLTTVDNILKILDAVRFSGISQISAKFVKDGVLVMAIYLTNIINVSIKIGTFPSKYKIAKIKPLLEKGIKTEAKN